jgi:hypothetical protein
MRGRVRDRTMASMPNPITIAVAAPFVVVGALLDVTFPRPPVRLG